MKITVKEPPREKAQFGILIFTYPRDFSPAARAVLAVSRTWKRTGLENPPKYFWCVHKRDADAARLFLKAHWAGTVFADTPKPEIIEHEFDAGGHLQCLSACGGMKKIFWDLFYSEPYKGKIDALIKMDSDVILLRPEQWTMPWLVNRADYVYVPQAPCRQVVSAENPLAADGTELAEYKHLGCGWCYLLSSYAAHVIGMHPADKFKHLCARNYGAEDRVFGRLLQEAHGVITSEVSPKGIIGKSFEAAPDEATTLILDNPKDNFGKTRYSWRLEEFTAR